MSPNVERPSAREVIASGIAAAIYGAPHRAAVLAYGDEASSVLADLAECQYGLGWESCCVIGTHR